MRARGRLKSGILRAPSGESRNTSVRARLKNHCDRTNYSCFHTQAGNTDTVISAINPTSAEDSSVNFECGLCVDRKLESIATLERFAATLERFAAALQAQVDASPKPVNKPVLGVAKISQSI